MARRAVAVAVVFLVLLAGCGATPDATPTPEPDPAEPTGTPTVDETGTDGETETGTEEPTPTPDASDVDGVDGELEVHFINVGQADATLLIGPTGETMLVDTGDWRDDGSTVVDYLEARGVDRIDYLVSTHAHADHIGGHATVIDHFETEKDGVGAVYDSGVPHTTQTYGNYLDAVEEHDVTLYEVREGDDVPFDGVDVTILNPAVDTEADDLHYDSVSLHLAFGSTSFLLTGDAEGDAEARMRDEHSDRLDADVYHAGHHGSNTSSTAPFLDAVDPTVAIVSSGYDSQYGHPHDEVLDGFAERGIDTYWTATHGTTVTTSDGETITVATQHDATVDAAALRSADEATADPTESPEDRRSYRRHTPPIPSLDRPTVAFPSLERSATALPSPDRTETDAATPVPAVTGGAA